MLACISHWNIFFGFQLLVMKKIVITAANGFLGESMIEFLLKRHPEITIIAIVRRLPKHPNINVTYALWDGEHIGKWANHFNEADAIINFAGKSVDCRYNDKNRAAIFNSRLKSTWLIGQAIRTCAKPPKLWINAASATIYEHSLDVPNNEKTGTIGHGFSVEVCQQWEATFFHAETPKTRKLALRTTIVLGKNGGVYPVLKRLAQAGLGGKMGPGNQRFSWIHLGDFCEALYFLMEHPTTEPIVNIGSPNPVSNKEMQSFLRQSIGKKWGLPAPKWLLELGAILLQTETELVLKSRYIEPLILTEMGFKFKYPMIDKCFAQLNQ